jgi:Na+/proline symporter
VGYTLIGGFLAAVWTDLLQSVMMIIGVSAAAGNAVGSFESAAQSDRQRR